MNKNILLVANNKEIDDTYCPLPLEVIPNYMGINLCSVKSIEWEEKDDKQLTYLTITFLPKEN